MSCPFYWYNHHYACRKSGKDVNEDTYYKYCRNYDYDDCPIYKQRLQRLLPDLSLHRGARSAGRLPRADGAAQLS